MVSDANFPNNGDSIAFSIIGIILVRSPRQITYVIIGGVVVKVSNK